MSPPFLSPHFCHTHNAQGKLHDYAAEQLDAKYNKPKPTGSVERRAGETQTGQSDRLIHADMDNGGESKTGTQRRQYTVAVEANSEYVRRVYQELYKTLDGNTLPTTSFLAYKPSADEPFVVFKADSETGSVSIVPVTMSSNPRIFLLMLFSFFIPAVVGVLFTIKLALWYKSTIDSHRKEIAVNEMGRRKLLSAAIDAVDSEENQKLESTEKAEDDPRGSDLSLLKLIMPEETAAIVHQTSFFYFVELCIVDPKKMKSFQVLFLIALVQTVTLLSIAAPLFMIYSIYKAAHLQYVCPDAVDLVRCQAQTPMGAVLRSCTAILLSVGIVDCTAHQRKDISLYMLLKLVYCVIYIYVCMYICILLCYIYISIYIYIYIYIYIR